VGRLGRVEKEQRVLRFAQDDKISLRQKMIEAGPSLAQDDKSCLQDDKSCFEVRVRELATRKHSLGLCQKGDESPGLKAA